MFLNRLIKCITSIVFLLFIAAGLSACGEKPLAHIKQVDPMAKVVMESLKTADMKALLDLYSADFYKSRPREAWEKQLKEFFEKYGPVTRYSFRNKQADTRFRGKFFIYQYDTLHEPLGKTIDKTLNKGRRVKHIITFIHPVDNDVIQLVGHKMTAARL